MENKQTIGLKTVLHEINEPGRVFSLEFRKLNGDLSAKESVKKNPTKASASDPGKPGQKRDLESFTRHLNHTSTLMLFDCIARHPFEAKIELLVSFDGHPIFHNY